MRLIVVFGQVWKWRYGKKNIVVISPDGEKYKTTINEVGAKITEVKHPTHSHFGVGVTPKMIREWIIKKFYDTWGER